MDEAKLRTLSVLVDNEAGILSQVSRLFSRKGFNIESLAVGPTDDPTISRITIEVLTNDNQTQLLCNQLAKMSPSTPFACCPQSIPSAGNWSFIRSRRRAGTCATR